MRRIVVAFALAPVLAALLFGWPGVVLVLPFAWAITLVLAVPLFVLFRKLGWLKWWQVALAGFLCGLIFSVLFAAPSLERIDAFGIPDALTFGGTGTLIAIVFWWLGLYRNTAFPAISPSIPYGMLTLIPLAVLGALWHQSFHPTFAEGRIVAVKGEPPSREVTVRLSNGPVVQTSLQHDSRPTAVLMNQCWHLMNHWSTFRFRHIYSLMAPFGGGVDDC